MERGARWEERQGSGGDEDNQGWLLELGDQPGNSDDEEDVDKNIQGWLLELGDQPVLEAAPPSPPPCIAGHHPGGATALGE